jgi:hypothetical protein
MKVEEIREVILRDSFNNHFLGYEKGLLKLKNTTNETQYNVRVSSLVFTKIVDRGTENVEG